MENLAVGLRNWPKKSIAHNCPRRIAPIYPLAPMKWMGLLLHAISHDHHLCPTNHLHLWVDSFHYNITLLLMAFKY